MPFARRRIRQVAYDLDSGALVYRYATRLQTVGPGGRTVIIRANGLAKNLPSEGSIDTVGFLVIDSTAQPWRARQRYAAPRNSNFSSFVTPTDNTNQLAFQAYTRGADVTGLSEPGWSTDGGTTVFEGGIEWYPQGLYKTWAAETAFTSGDIIFESGVAWFAQASDTSGTEKPDFATGAAAYLASLTGEAIPDGEGALTWTPTAPALGAWTPSTRVEYALSDDRMTTAGPYVVPTTVVPGETYAFSVQLFHGAFPVSGETEPDWSGETPGQGHYYLDGEVLWQEYAIGSATAGIVMTGLGTPAGGLPQSLYVVYFGAGQLTLADQSDVVSNFGDSDWPVGAEGSEIVSDAQFEAGGSDVALDPLQFKLVIYDPDSGTWKVTNLT